MPPRLRCPTIAALVLCAASAFAQSPYKVVGADGRVTYTDRLSTGAADSRIAPLRAAPPAGSAEVALPFELRQAASRYPVTLYVSGAECAPCGAARELLRQRGVPFAEHTVQSSEDVLAFERLSGGREAPTVTIGGEVLRSLTPSVWQTTLDAAGYPRESQLPATYRYPAPSPLVAPAATVSTPAPDLPLTLPSLPISAGPIRF